MLGLVVDFTVVTVVVVLEADVDALVSEVSSGVVAVVAGELEIVIFVLSDSVLILGTAVVRVSASVVSLGFVGLSFDVEVSSGEADVLEVDSPSV